MSIDVVSPDLRSGLRHQFAHRTIVVFVTVGYDNPLDVPGPEPGAFEAMVQFVEGAELAGVDQGKALVVE
jgi:hypothetical protein